MRNDDGTEFSDWWGVRIFIVVIVFEIVAVIASAC